MRGIKDVQTVAESRTGARGLQHGVRTAARSVSVRRKGQPVPVLPLSFRRLRGVHPDAVPKILRYLGALFPQHRLNSHEGAGSSYRSKSV